MDKGTHTYRKDQLDHPYALCPVGICTEITKNLQLYIATYCMIIRAFLMNYFTDMSRMLDIYIYIYKDQNNRDGVYEKSFISHVRT